MKTDETELALSIGGAIEKIKALEIVTAEQFQQAGEFLRAIKTTSKEVDAHFQPEYDRVYSAYKDLLDRRKSYQNMLAEAEATIKVKMGVYTRMVEARAAEERRKIAEQQAAERAAAEAAGAVAFDIVEPAAPVVEAPKVDGVYEVTTYSFEIVDAEQIPRQYLSPDEKKIGAVVRALGAGASIPGVKVIESKSIRARAAK